MAEPWQVLEFIDRIENPRKPLVITLGSASNMAQVLPHAEIALLAAKARLEDGRKHVAVLRKLVEAHSELAELYGETT